MLSWIGKFDPAPLFALSLLTYLPFLCWAQRSNRFPKLALFGFFSTLLFVAISIVSAILSSVNYEMTLVDIDAIHGSAEFFLTISNLIIIIGFSSFKKSA